MDKNASGLCLVSDRSYHIELLHLIKCFKRWKRVQYQAIINHFG